MGLTSPVGLDAVHRGVAIDLARAGKEEPRAVGLGPLEGVSCAVAPHVERLERKLDVVDGTRWRGEVVDAVERALHGDPGDEIGMDQGEPWVWLQRRDVRPLSGHKVVKRDHLVTIREQALAEVGGTARAAVTRIRRGAPRASAQRWRASQPGWPVRATFRTRQRCVKVRKDIGVASPVGQSRGRSCAFGGRLKLSP